MRSLADRINAELRVLRRQQNRFCQGDLELKNAITNISHDLHTPLTAICGYLEIVLRESGEITFTNHAPELNEIQVGRLFDRFYTVEAARKSTGLGLAISRTLIEKMGGTISAHYQNGKLSICIRLP